jgi:pimeloyl-ACP methyl ester carboxylesterase
MHIPPADLDDDIVFIRRHAKALIDDGQDLIVVLHSYGGVVGSYSFVDFPAPAAADHAVGGCLRAIVYMAAFMPLAGEGLNDILLPIFGPPKGPPPFVQVDKERGLDVLPVEAAAEYFYQDCTKEEQQRAAALLTPQSSDAPQDAPKRSAVLTELGVTGPHALPELKMSYTRKGVQVVYLYCDLDAGLTLPLQEMMVGRVKKLGVDVYEKHIQAGHSPFSCKPSETAAAVHEMVGLRA